MISKKKLRLQKFLSERGIASRREGEKMIAGGRVRVNGQIVRQMGVVVDPEQDRIEVDDVPVLVRPRLVYFLFHKPKNVMVTRNDPEGRPTIFDYLKKIPERVNYVGRLDFDSEGLILLTNDGELQNRLTHPSKEIPKTYQVKIAPTPHPNPSPAEGRGDIIRELSNGVDIGGYVTAPCQVRILDDNWLEIILTEGKNRQIRRMCEAVGLTVLRLIRTAIGPLTLGNLQPGTSRPLSPVEINQLLDLGSHRSC